MVLRLLVMALMSLGQGDCAHSCNRDGQSQQGSYLWSQERVCMIVGARILPSQHLLAGDGEGEQQAERAQLLWRIGAELPPPTSILVEQDMAYK